MGRDVENEVARRDGRDDAGGGYAGPTRTRHMTLLIRAIVAVSVLGVLVPLDWSVIVREPGPAVFALVLAALHALPFLLAARRMRRLANLGRIPIVAAALALLVQAGTLAAMWSALDSDAQAALGYLFLTLPIAWLTCGAMVLVSAVGTRRARREAPRAPSPPPPGT